MREESEIPSAPGSYMIIKICTCVKHRKWAWSVFILHLQNKWHHVFSVVLLEDIFDNQTPPKQMIALPFHVFYILSTQCRAMECPYSWKSMICSRNIPYPYQNSEWKACAVAYNKVHSFEYNIPECNAFSFTVAKSKCTILLLTWSVIHTAVYLGAKTKSVNSYFYTCSRVNQLIFCWMA